MSNEILNNNLQNYEPFDWQIGIFLRWLNQNDLHVFNKNNEEITDADTLLAIIRKGEK